MLEFITDREIYEKAVLAVSGAKKRVWIATENIMECNAKFAVVVQI